MNPVFEFDGKYFVPVYGEGLVETEDIEGLEVIKIVGESTLDVPFTYENRYQQAYGSLQSTKANFYYREINRELKLVASRSEIEPTLKKMYNEYLAEFKTHRHWKAIIEETPRLMAKSLVRRSSAKNWPTFILEVINYEHKVGDTYALWLILRWLRLKIAHLERPVQDTPKQLTARNEIQETLTANLENGSSHTPTKLTHTNSYTLPFGRFTNYKEQCR